MLKHLGPRRVSFYILIFAILVIAPGVLAKMQASALPAKAQRALNRGLEYAKAEKWDLAIKSFKEAQGLAPYQPQCLLNIALAFDKRGGKDVATLFWYRAYLKAAPDADNRPQVEKRMGELEKAIYDNLKKLYALAEKTTEKMEEYYVEGHPDYLPDGTDTEEEAAKDRETARELSDGRRAGAYMNLAVLAFDLGYTDKVEEMLGRMQACTKANDLDLERQRAYWQNADLEVTRGEISQAIVIAEGVKTPVGKAEIYLAMVKRLAKCGEIQRAQDLFAKALVYAQGVPQDADKANYYHDLLEAYLALGDIDKAQETLDLIDDEIWRGDALNDLKKARNKKPQDKIDEWVAFAKQVEDCKYCVDLAGYVSSLKGQTPDFVIFDIAEAIDRLTRAIEDRENCPCS